MGPRIFRHASQFGYYLATCLIVLVCIFIVGRAISHIQPYGIRVHIARDLGNAQPMRAIDPILVTIGRRCSW